MSVPGGSFGRRMSLASLGAVKYELIGDIYGGERGAVIVRNVPIVIEGESDDKAAYRNWPTSPSPETDDRVSLSSRSSDNSVETSRRKEGSEESGAGYQSWDDWRRRRRKGGSVELGEENELSSPFKNMESKSEKPKIQATRRSSLPGPWYLLKAETVGVENCLVHGCGEREGDKENEARKSNKVGHAYGLIRTPSVLKSTKAICENNSSAIKAERPKHSAHCQMNPSSTNVFERGPGPPGQGSFRGRRSKTSSGAQKDVKKQVEDPKASTMEFQRHWSLRGPSLTLNTGSANIPTSPQIQTVPSLSKPLGLSIPEYFRVASKDGEEKHFQSMKKYSSQTDLHYNLNQAGLRNTSSSSTSSIPSKVSKSRDLITKDNPPSAGILKTPGKRKVSSNRVEFLSNIMEREIPGRHT